MLARAIEEFLAATTTGPSETQFWQPLAPVLELIEQHSVFAGANNVTCHELTNLAADANRLALCTYLQGFYDLAQEITFSEISVLNKVSCPCARICEVQPWVNLARLARAMLEPNKLDEAITGLETSLERALATDPSSVPVDASVSLIDGSIAKAAQYVGIMERIKLNWLSGDFAGCEELARPISELSSVAMEFMIRSLIELGYLDNAISLAASRISRFQWLSAYAVIALLKGGAHEEARRVLAAINGDYALPLLRVATELVHAGLSSDAARLGVRIAAAGVSSRHEVPAQLALTFLIANRYTVPADLRESVVHTATTSQHYPSAILFYIATSPQNGDDHLNEIILESASMLHPASLPNSIRTFRHSSEHSQSRCDSLNSYPMRIKTSRSAISGIAGRLFRAIRTH